LPVNKAADSSHARQAQPSSLNSSRLVRHLSDLAAPGVDVARGQFAQRLSRLIDFSDSIKLSAVHARLGTTPFEPSGQSGAAIQEGFLRRRQSLAQSIARSFTPGASPMRSRLPQPEAGPAEDDTAAFDPYLKFYKAQQRHLDFTIQGIQDDVRREVAGLAPGLDELVTMDTALGNTLVSHARKYFAAIPGLLGRRFALLLQQYRQASSDEQHRQTLWLQLHTQFCTDMQESLLAELEARLLPSQGLIEAIEDHQKPS
jgi:hypothetical protein